MGNPYQPIAEIRAQDCTPAQMALQSAILELLQEKDLANISVYELSRRAFVARSTFYAYYQNTDELLAGIEDRLVNDLLKQNQSIMQHGKHQIEDVRFYADTLAYVKKNKKIFYTLLIARPNQRFIDKWKAAIKCHFWERLFVDREAANSGFLLEMVAAWVLAAFTYWLKESEEIDLERIYPLIAQVLEMLDYGEKKYSKT